MKSNIIELNSLFVIKEEDVIMGFTKKSLPFREDNINRILSEIEIDNLDLKIIHLSQVHSNRIIYIGEHTEFHKIAGDGLISSCRNVFLYIRTADCIPLFLWNQNYVGILHCGWRSLACGILNNLEYFLDFKSTKFLIGPGIRKCCYKISEDLVSYFPQNVFRKDSQLYLDLVEVIVENMHQKGAKLENIEDSKFCTSCRNDLFFSYRKEKTQERIVNFIVRV